MNNKKEPREPNVIRNISEIDDDDTSEAETGIVNNTVNASALNSAFD